MQNLTHLIGAIRQRLSEEDTEFLEFASRRYDREPYDASLYDQAFDRVLSRLRREQGPELQRRSELSS